MVLEEDGLITDPRVSFPPFSLQSKLAPVPIFELSSPNDLFASEARVEF